MADRIILDPARFRFAQRFTAKWAWKEIGARMGVHICPQGYVATDGLVLILIPSGLTTDKPETILAPKLPPNVSALAWIPDGRWLEVETYHGDKGKLKRRVRYALDAPQGSFPRMTTLYKLMSKPVAPTASIVIDPTLLVKFGKESLLEFRGADEYITVSPGGCPDFPWVGVLMPCRNIFSQPAGSIIQQFFPEGEPNENHTPAS